ncbi:amino acid permease [Sansalvadorimonas sp. 2012CJ34-2]|uniref:Amino acid permease n=1 Tax=Parendozoicomonas callyspongiae TaxID=2942213 RepID=A0ABT0PLV1_9GAMM|nr:amino acid permease [Sansalvadorimonas sp. 2012CJ34-2]MCL6271961.1 amino acid permease [Sansalvadorimonas sp. 2012CJ34-2]
MAVVPTRHISLSRAVFLIVANVIGVGTFTTTGYVLGEVLSRETTLLVWSIGGVIALCGALSYGALAKLIPESGGEYLFLSKMFHPVFGCIAGWVSLLVGFTASIALCAYALGVFIQPLFPWLDSRVIASVMVLIAAQVLSLKANRGVKALGYVVILKLALLTVFIIAGGLIISVEPSQGMRDIQDVGLSNAALASVMVYFGYSGWNAVIYIADEVKNPDRNLYKATVLGTLLIIALTLILNTIILYSGDAGELINRLDVFQIVGHRIGGNVFKWLVGTVVMLALCSSLSAMIMMGPRVYAKMAEDGYLPGWLSSGRHGFSTSVWFQAAIAVVMLWSGTYQQLMTYAGYTLGISCMMTISGLIRWKLNDPDNISIPFWPYAPCLFLLINGVITIYVVWCAPLYSLLGLIPFAAGIISWYLKERNTPKTMISR